MSIEEKRKILETLEKDVEFRYALMGLLGYRELLDRFSRLEEEQRKLWENQNRLWEEIRALREEQKKLWENINRLWEEVRALREGQNKLWENQNRLWEEVKALRESQNKLWEEVRNLKVSHERLEKYVRSGFRELRRTLGSTFEDYTAAFVEVMLEDRGFKDVSVERKFLVYGGEVLEINLFCEKPLVVGEVTLKVEDVRGAEEEVMKLLKRVEVVKEVYKAEPVMKVLAVGRASVEASKVLRELAEKYGIKLLIGSEIDWEY